MTVLNEAMDESKKRNLSIIFFKIDFTKAYDPVEWSFIDLMMEHFNFSLKWRKWIMECISSASAPVLVNGSPSDEFKLKR